jgi:hypothetical protein
MQNKLLSSILRSLSSNHISFNAINNNNNNNNRPDITFINKKAKNTFLIDIAVPNTHNLAKTITDKQNKYQELANEIHVYVLCKSKTQLK